ncbi:hypothetical protein LTR66_016510, partial [Elasticomyces elasticus]
MQKPPQYLRDHVQQYFDDRIGRISTRFEDIAQLSDYTARLTALLYRRHVLTQSLIRHGCVPELIYERARTYEQLEYDDLAIFDAYAAYMLCQKRLCELIEEDEFVTDLEACDQAGEVWKPDQEAATVLIVSALELIVRCLQRLEVQKDVEVMQDQLDHYRHEAVPINPELELVLRTTTVSMDYEPTYASHSRREVYPWSTYEPDRNSDSSVFDINKYLASIAPQLEAKVTSLPALDSHGRNTGKSWTQLGLFSKSDLTAGKVVLREKSILTAIRPLEDAICDACGQDLEGLSFEDIRQCDGEDCDTTFCSKECKERAAREYHKPYIENQGEHDHEDREVNGKQAHDSTHDDSPTICSNPDLCLIGRNTGTKTPEWDLYFLLLTRTISMSIAQNIHPLELTET